MRLSALGMNDCAISRLIGVPHRTIHGWRVDGLKERSKRTASPCPICGDGLLNEEAYAFLLGLYLGDGCIVRTHREGVYKLEIFLDAKYPGIIEECSAALTAVRTNGSKAVGKYLRDGCVNVNTTWRHWLCLFPQHGRGMNTKGM